MPLAFLPLLLQGPKGLDDLNKKSSGQAHPLTVVPLRARPFKSPLKQPMRKAAAAHGTSIQRWTVQGKMFRFPCQSLDVALEADYRRKNTRQANHYCISWLVALFGHVLGHLWPASSSCWLLLDPTMQGTYRTFKTPFDPPRKIGQHGLGFRWMSELGFCLDGSFGTVVRALQWVHAGRQVTVFRQT